ncbi:hypothetical protein BHE97_07455 [Aeromicrobium sp. PE09-221]|uniref:DUF5709 domain-containing protein n=1 Tax=Aeromicrobium sp. PE09-221 TaxID=1898043 RepID=UPI000B3E8433|nr:DUF5709 domain-containing protein [Aeromicrobium sp. PE09-221]OUZ10407.1 hypothetical protein BHE97_07455 [Aeromicrobium sp. PE09-221]
MSNTPDETPADSQFLSQDPPEDTLIERGVDDPLDEGFSAPERWSAGEGFGTTPEEELQGESLDQRLAQEIPDADPYAEVVGEDLDDGEVGRDRSGRLVDPDAGIGEDVESELLGSDAGIDGAAASAEEAAVHTIDDEE